MKIVSSFILAAGLIFSGTALAKDAGTLTVIQTPVQNRSIPLGGNRIPVLTLAAQASCDAAVTLKTITMHHTGLGDMANIAGIYALEGGIRKSRGVTFQKKTASATLRLSGVTLKACEKRSITLAIDLSPDASAGSEHAFTLESGADIGSDATVTLESQTPAKTAVAPSSGGSVTYAEVPLASRNVLFGKGRTLLRFSLKAGAGKDQSIAAITFTNDGSAAGTDIENLGVYDARGNLLSDVSASLKGSAVRISFSTPLLLPKNASRLFQLRGDVTASRKRTIELTVQESSDIETQSRRTRLE